MLPRECPVCDDKLNDGDKVAIVMLSTYREIPSETVGAVDEPKVCLAIMHKSCYDFEEETGEEE